MAESHLRADWDQLQAQRSETSMEQLYLLPVGAGKENVGLHTVRFDVVELIQIGDGDSSAASRTTTRVVKEELVSRSRKAVSDTADHGPVATRPSQLDVGLDCWSDEPSGQRREDLNNNDDDVDDDGDGRPSGEFQTNSCRWIEDPERGSRPVLEAGQNVKFIDDEYESESDGGGVDQREADGGRSTASDEEELAADDDGGSGTFSAVLGRRWGTVDLLEPSPISPLPSPGAVPLKSIMKSPNTSTTSSELTLVRNKKGISFSQDTVFK